MHDKFCKLISTMPLFKFIKAQEASKRINHLQKKKYTEKHIKLMMYFLNIGARKMPSGNNASLIGLPIVV